MEEFIFKTFTLCSSWFCGLEILEGLNWMVHLVAGERCTSRIASSPPCLVPQYFLASLSYHMVFHPAGFLLHSLDVTEGWFHGDCYSYM